ncbi:MAG: ABC transporter ATP-binding protein [Acidobacteriota bacterium]
MSFDVLEASQVTKRFSSHQVLRGVDLSVPQGSVMGLLGRNGAGKSTLLQCAVGLLKVDGGELSLLGEDSWRLSASAKSRLGFVAQTPELTPWMRGRKLLEYAASFYPRWNWDLVRRLVALWEIDLRARVRELSEGHRRQLAIILALAPEPEVLILDEPVAGLDPVARRTFLQELIDVALEGERTVLFSTHITADLERVADRVALLADGRIRFNDRLDVLKERVVKLYVRSQDALPSTLGVPGTLREDVGRHEAMVVVEGLETEAVDGLRDRLRAHVEVKHLGLDDIFLEMHHAG